jgi:acetyl-CoA acetyltransferase
MATTIISNQIRSGQTEIGLAVGFESMSQKYVKNSSLIREAQLCKP